MTAEAGGEAFRAVEDPDMFDHIPAAPRAQTHRPLPLGRPDATGETLPFVLTRASDDLAAAMAGEARPVDLGRFATLVEAMRNAVLRAAQTPPDRDAPWMLAILDREARLVLAGVVAGDGVTWCPPVLSAAEARATVSEASDLRALALRAADWREPGLARRLRHRADLLEARLVDPLWRAFAARALELAA